MSAFGGGLKRSAQYFILCCIDRLSRQHKVDMLVAVANIRFRRQSGHFDRLWNEADRNRISASSDQNIQRFHKLLQL